MLSKTGSALSFTLLVAGSWYYETESSSGQFYVSLTQFDRAQPWSEFTQGWTYKTISNWAGINKWWWFWAKSVVKKRWHRQLKEFCKPSKHLREIFRSSLMQSKSISNDFYLQWTMVLTHTSPTSRVQTPSLDACQWISLNWTQLQMLQMVGVICYLRQVPEGAVLCILCKIDFQHSYFKLHPYAGAIVYTIGSWARWFFLF